MIKPKVSSLIAGQLPEFIQSDYQTFIAFLEAYYDYLDQNVLVDYSSVSDIDSTYDSFLQYFKSELAINFPTFNVNDRFLLPKIKQLYTSKGSEASYRLLFRILYGKEIDIVYPSEQMLRVSDGKWVQDTSIFIRVSVGTPDLIVGKTITISTEGKLIHVFIDRYSSTSDASVFEFFVTGGWTGSFDVGSAVLYKSSFAGYVVATTKTVHVLQAGKNFSVGQVYPLTGSGSGSSIIVLKVDVNGGIKLAKLYSFGIGYASDFSTSFISSSSSLTTQNYFNVSGSSVSILDSINSLGDYGTINAYNYTSDVSVYVDPTYSGTIVRSFSNTSSSVVAPQTDYAIISVTLGSYAKYPGYYKNDDGFLDSTRYIQDSKYYQAFSYVIKIDELFESYRSVVKNLLHPSGTELFGENSITKTYNANLNLPSLVGKTTRTVMTESGLYYVISQDGYTIITEDPYAEPSNLLFKVVGVTLTGSVIAATSVDLIGTTATRVATSTGNISSGTFLAGTTANATISSAGSVFTSKNVTINTNRSIIYVNTTLPAGVTTTYHTLLEIMPTPVVTVPSNSVLLVDTLPSSMIVTSTSAITTTIT